MIHISALPNLKQGSMRLGCIDCQPIKVKLRKTKKKGLKDLNDLSRLTKKHNVFFDMILKTRHASIFSSWISIVELGLAVIIFLLHQFHILTILQVMQLHYL